MKCETCGQNILEATSEPDDIYDCYRLCVGRDDNNDNLYESGNSEIVYEECSEVLEMLRLDEARSEAKRWHATIIEGQGPDGKWEEVERTGAFAEVRNLQYKCEYFERKYHQLGQDYHDCWKNTYQEGKEDAQQEAGVSSVEVDKLRRQLERAKEGLGALRHYLPGPVKGILADIDAMEQDDD